MEAICALVMENHPSDYRLPPRRECAVLPRRHSRGVRPVQRFENGAEVFVIGEPGLFRALRTCAVQQPDGLLYALHVQRVQKVLAGDRFKAPAQIAGGYPHLFREGFNAQALLAVRGNVPGPLFIVGVLLRGFLSMTSARRTWLCC